MTPPALTGEPIVPAGELGGSVGAIESARPASSRPPVSRMTKPRVTGRSILLKWSGVDAAPAGVQAAGVDHYEVWRQAGTRMPQRIRIVKGTSMRLRGVAGSKYGFFTVAVDTASNRELAPAKPDVRVTLKKAKRKRARR